MTTFYFFERYLLFHLLVPYDRKQLVVCILFSALSVSADNR